MKRFIASALCTTVFFTTFHTVTAQLRLEGFTYGVEAAPAGKEWEAPQHLAHNKEQPRATFYNFVDVESARKVLPENSQYWQSLDGEWKFHWVGNPEERPKDFFKPDFDVANWDDITVPSNWNLEGLGAKGEQKYGMPIYCNQPYIFQTSLEAGDWKGGVMREPIKEQYTFKNRNEVGSYRRDFEVPTDWDGREVYVQFDGVDSFFYLWINGKYIGFAKNSRNAAIFDITPYLKKGSNVMAAEVYRLSDGSFLEAQDMFRLPGIFRSVSLHSTPKVQIRDLFVLPELDANYENAKLDIKATVRNLSGEEVKGYTIDYSLFANSLFSDENEQVAGVSAQSPVPALTKKSEENTVVSMEVKAPKKWTSEAPYRYVLVAELKDAQGTIVETVSLYTGFRKVEIKDTLAKDDEFGLAGRYYYINGMPVKLKGVNRHETCPKGGHTLTNAQMKEEVMLMLRGNINHVRNSHYPTDPYFYYLCDKYGIYLEDEANIESHGYRYGAASLSHPPEWKNAHVGRVMEMFHQNKNHASIVIWSLGNEAGPGKNFVHAYNALKTADTSRPVQYERNNSIVDMGSNQYPSIGWMKNAVTGKMNIKYPFHISEYAHSMGNACGNLIDYWDAIESTNFFCGGAIWDWVDQAVYNYTADGTRYLAYGGDFGDKPNSGQFVMNGIIFAERDLKPQYYEVKKVYQYVGIKAIDVKSGAFEVFNKNYFTDLSNYDVQWSVWKDGSMVCSGDVTMPSIPARTKKSVKVSYGDLKLDPKSEYFVKIQFTQKNDQPWAKAGYVQFEEQMLLQKAGPKSPIATAAGQKKMKFFQGKEENIQIVKGDGFVAKFNTADGSLYGLVYGEQTIIADGQGPKLDAFRAFINNDTWGWRGWFDKGLHNLKHKALSSKVRKGKNGNILLSFTVFSQAPTSTKIKGGTSTDGITIKELDHKKSEYDFHFMTNQHWTVYSDGSIELQASIASNDDSFVLPRLGYSMTLPKELSEFTYYGRGPIGNYNDRKTAQNIEKFKSTVGEQYVNFPTPQDMANHEEVRWCALTHGDVGAVFIATGDMAVSALPYTALEMAVVGHQYELPKPGDTTLHLDSKVSGLGGASCGQGGPLTQDRAYAKQTNFGVIIRPAGKDLAQIANVSGSEISPLAITRTSGGEVNLVSGSSKHTVCYSLNNGPTQEFSTPFMLLGAGEVKAWYKGHTDTEIKIKFSRIEKEMTTVLFASSEEPRGNNSAKNLTDGDPSTGWHTAYSVTVAQYPHWVDFDGGKVKMIKGFSYTPLQGSGTNGDIKKYSIQVSMNGKTWGKPIKQGRFSKDKKVKRVIFKKPVKARYLRFTAISSQNKQDFAGGAEFSLLTD